MHDVYFPGSAEIYQAGFKIVEVPLRSDLDKGRRTIHNRCGDFVACSRIVIVVASFIWWLRPQRRKRP